MKMSISLLDFSTELAEKSIIYELLFLVAIYSTENGNFELTTSLESTVPESISTISVSQKLDMSIKRSAKQKNFSFFIRTPKT